VVVLSGGVAQTVLDVEEQADVRRDGIRDLLQRRQAAG